MPKTAVAANASHKNGKARDENDENAVSQRNLEISAGREGPGIKLCGAAGHENFLAPQGDLTAPFLRAGVDQFQSSFDIAKFRLGAGLFESHSNPLVTGIGVTLHLKLWGGFQVNGNTFRSPDGKTRYIRIGQHAVHAEFSPGRPR